MWILTTLVAAAVPVVVAVNALPPAPTIIRSEPVLVTFVFDGDTIEVATFGRVRLLGIDAPEIGRGFDTSAPFGREARDRLSGMILHRWVRLEREGPALDAYNRHLAYVMREDGVCVNTAMVRDGFARVTARRPLARLPELKRAEAEAQMFRKGMWGATPQIRVEIPSASYTRPSGAKRSPASKRKTPTARKKKKPT